MKDTICHNENRSHTKRAEVTRTFYQLFFSSLYLDILENHNQNFSYSFKTVFTCVLAQSYQRHKFETLFIVLVK